MYQFKVSQIYEGTILNRQNATGAMRLRQNEMIYAHDVRTVPFWRRVSAWRFGGSTVPLVITSLYETTSL
jgi:hypothetical protein